MDEGWAIRNRRPPRRYRVGLKNKLIGDDARNSMGRGLIVLSPAMRAVTLKTYFR